MADTMTDQCENAPILAPDGGSIGDNVAEVLLALGEDWTSLDEMPVRNNFLDRLRRRGFIDRGSKPNPERPSGFEVWWRLTSVGIELKAAILDRGHGEVSIVERVRSKAALREIKRQANIARDIEQQQNAALERAQKAALAAQADAARARKWQAEAERSPSELAGVSKRRLIKTRIRLLCWIGGGTASEDSESYWDANAALVQSYEPGITNFLWRRKARQWLIRQGYKIVDEDDDAGDAPDE